MTIKSAYLGNAIDPKHRDLYGRVPGPAHFSGDQFESSATERANALMWALQHREPESPYAVIARAEVYLRYLAEGVTASSDPSEARQSAPASG